MKNSDPLKSVLLHGASADAVTDTKKKDGILWEPA